MGISTVIVSSKCYVDVAAFLEDYQPHCRALVLADPWCCSGGGGDGDV